MKKKFTALLLTTTIIMTAIPSVMANEAIQKTLTAVPINAVMTSFSDLEYTTARADIDYLVGRDIVRGYGDSLFRPEAKLTIAEAMTLLTSGFELKNEIVASTVEALPEFKYWYSAAFSAAIANEIAVEQSADPDAVVTREQFASWIVKQLDRVGPYPVVRMYINIEDSEQLSAQFANDVQVLLLTRITSLGEDQNFRPQDAITRAEAADWIADAVKFADQIKEAQMAGELEQAAAIEQSEFIANLKSVLKLEEATTISADDKSTAVVTREQAATWIIDELNKKGPFPVKMMLIHMVDDADMKEEHKNNIHTLLLIDVAELDEEGKFHPKAELTNAEASDWMQKVEEFAAKFE